MPVGCGAKVWLSSAADAQAVRPLIGISGQVRHARENGSSGISRRLLSINRGEKLRDNSSDFQNRLLTFLKISITVFPIPSHQEGRHAIVTFAGRGAVDANGATDERAVLRTAKPCGSGAPLQASSSRRRESVARMTGSTKQLVPEESAE